MTPVDQTEVFRLVVEISVAMPALNLAVVRDW
jgi:hypothetical protein